MGLSGSFALPVLRTVSVRGSRRAVTLPCGSDCSVVVRRLPLDKRARRPLALSAARCGCEPAADQDVRAPSQTLAMCGRDSPNGEQCNGRIPSARRRRVRPRRSRSPFPWLRFGRSVSSALRIWGVPQSTVAARSARHPRTQNPSTLFRAVARQPGEVKKSHRKTQNQSSRARPLDKERTQSARAGARLRARLSHRSSHKASARPARCPGHSSSVVGPGEALDRGRAGAVGHGARCLHRPET